MTVLDLAPIDQLPLPLDWQVAPGIDSPPPVPRHLRLVGAARMPTTRANRQPMIYLSPGWPRWRGRSVRLVSVIAHLAN